MCFRLSLSSVGTRMTVSPPHVDQSAGVWLCVTPSSLWRFRHTSEIRHLGSRLLQVKQRLKKASHLNFLVSQCIRVMLWCHCSVAQSFLTLCDPWTAARQASLCFTISWSLLKLISFESVMPSNHLILCRPLLLPSVFPSIMVFSSESAPL